MSFTCPVCGAVSHNPNDELNGWCARCNDFVAPAVAPHVSDEVDVAWMQHESEASAALDAQLRRRP